MKKLLSTILLGTCSLMMFGQVVRTVSTFTVPGAQFGILQNPASLQGTLTSVSINATLGASSGGTYANDLTIIVLPTNSFATTPLLQVGGDSNFGATERGGWANGGSATVGSIVNSTYTLTTPLNFTASPTYTIALGNGYANAATPTNSGTWNNITITLNGVTASSLGTTEISDKSDLGVTVYPNPVVDNINISSKNSKISLVSIVDGTGRAIKTVMTNNNSDVKVNVSELSTGNYMLIINTDKGNYTKKFIKK